MPKEIPDINKEQLINEMFQNENKENFKSFQNEIDNEPSPDLKNRAEIQLKILELTSRIAQRLTGQNFENEKERDI